MPPQFEQRAKGRGFASWRWLPLTAFLLVVLATLALWFAVHRREAQHNQALLHTEAMQTSRFVQSQLRSLATGLVRMARRWQMDVRPVTAQWTADARLYEELYPGYLAIQWLNPDLSVRWSVPPSESHPAGAGTVQAGKQTRNGVARCRRDPRRIGQVEYLLCAAGPADSPRVLDIVVPIGRDGPSRTFVIGTFELSDVLKGVFEQYLAPFLQVALVNDDGAALYRKGRPSDALETATYPVELPGIRWRVLVALAAEAVPPTGLLPHLILVIGLSLAMLVAFTAWLAQQAERRRAEALGTNARLTAEIRERKQTENKLRGSEERFRRMLESSPVGIVTLDRTGRFGLANAHFQSMVGYTEDELRRMRHSDLLAADQAQRTEALLAHLFQHEKAAVELEIRYADRQHGVIWAHVCAALVSGDQDEPDYAIAMVQDTTERKVAQQQLLESERRFRQLAENMREVFWIEEPGGAAGVPHYISPAYEEIWGRPCDEFHREPSAFPHAVHPDDADRVRESMSVLRRNGTPSDIEYRIVRPDGAIRWIWARAFAVTGTESSEPSRILGIAEDITQRRNAEEARLAAARDQRDVLVREIHHRIKNRLQGVAGLLWDHRFDHPECAEALSDAAAQIRAIATVHGIQGRSQSAAITLHDLIEAIVESTREAYPDVVIEPQAHAVPTFTPDEEEAVPVALIINELLANAVKHQLTDSADRRITIEIRYTSDTVHLRISNTGKALPAELDLGSGSGLGTGLNLVRSLLPKRGATLRITSEDDTVVATLTLTSPVVTAPPGRKGRR